MVDFSKIRLFCCDLDGTLTDGMYTVSDKGDVSKSFNTRDFMVMQRLYALGISTLILTHAMDDVIVHKWDQINPLDKRGLWYYRVRSPKDMVLEEVRKKLIDDDGSDPIEWDEIAYIGDTESDLDAMRKCAWTGCPADAEPIIRKEANYLCEAFGGQGAVYEFAMDLIFKIGEENGDANSDSETSDEVEEVAASSD